MDNAPSSSVASKEPLADYSGQAICEAAKVVGILAAFGCLSLLRGQFPEFLWIAGLAAGVLVLAAGLFHAVRLRVWRLFSALPVPFAAVSQPVLTILIGICLLLPALAAFGLRHQFRLEPGLLQIYLSTPAILVWIGGEVLFFRPLFYIRPTRIKEIAGLFGRGLQILGALLLWAFLGLSVGTGSITWMLWAAAGLSGLGLLLALATSSSNGPQAEVSTSAAQ